MGISLSTPINGRICTGVTECDVLIHAWLMVSCVNCYEKCLHSFHKSLVFNSIGKEVIPPITMCEREAPQHIQQKSCVLLTAETNIKEKHYYQKLLLLCLESLLDLSQSSTIMSQKYKTTKNDSFSYLNWNSWVSNYLVWKVCNINVPSHTNRKKNKKSFLKIVNPPPHPVKLSGRF